MTLHHKISLFFLAMMVAFVPSTAFTMENPKSEISLTEKHFSSVLPQEVQQMLIQEGRNVLTQIIDGNFDLAQSNLHQKLYPYLEPCIADSRYSSLVEYKPSNLLRWAFSSTEKEYIIRRKNSLSAIISISWALVDMAKDQNDFFERGSFTIIDPQHRLSHFFLDYVRLTTGYDDPQTVPFALTTCNFAYRRDPSLGGSSHHRNHCPESQFGIDVRYEPTQSVLKLLPFDSSHLLFAKLDLGHQEEPLLFVKLEDIGMGSIFAMATHGLNFAHSQSNVSTESRREKDIDKNLLAMFKELQTEAGLEGEFKTIRSMFLAAQMLLSDTLYKEKANSFITSVDKLYPNGNNHIRTGNEVILNLNNFRS